MNVFSTIMSLFGCFGSAFISLIISRWENLTSAATIMLILAIFDFLSTFFVFIFILTIPLLGFNLRNINNIWCALSLFTSNFILYTSYYLTVLFSFDKFLSVMFPFKYREYGKPFISICASFFIITIQMLWALPQLFVARIDSDLELCTPTNFEIVSSQFYLEMQPVLNIFLNGVIPVFLVFVFTFATIVKLRIRDRRRGIRVRDGSMSARREREMTRQMIVVSILFGTLCLVVTICVQVMYEINPKTSYELAITNFFYSIMMCSNSVINSANFFLYLIFGKKFRADFVKLFSSRQSNWKYLNSWYVM